MTALHEKADKNERDGQRFAAIVFLLILTLALAGCGKKGAPQPPPGEPNTYPRVYPSG
jgi:predicted small lipoprotein YifL